jgi:hypothetical protein
VGEAAVGRDDAWGSGCLRPPFSRVAQVYYSSEAAEILLEDPAALCTLIVLPARPAAPVEPRARGRPLSRARGAGR